MSNLFNQEFVTLRNGEKYENLPFQGAAIDDRASALEGESRLHSNDASISLVCGTHPGYQSVLLNDHSCRNQGISGYPLKRHPPSWR